MRRRLLCPGFVPELPPVCAALLLPCKREEEEDGLFRAEI
jgi:hypothetical protein